MAFGGASVFLIVCAWEYGGWALARAKLWQKGPNEEPWHFMRAHSVEFYLLYSGLVLIVVPALISASVWRDFHRRNPVTLLRKVNKRAVLVLRNFAGDESEPSTFRDIELALQKRIPQSLGPLVALGSPQDLSPPSGALRTYSREDGWKKEISRYIDLSGFVVLIVRHWSTAVMWEMDAVRRRIAPDQAVVILVHTVHIPGDGNWNSGCRLIVSKGLDDAQIPERVSGTSSALCDLAGAADGDSLNGVGDLYARMEKHVGETFHLTRDRVYQVLGGAVALGFEEDWSPVVLAQKTHGFFESLKDGDHLYIADEVWSRLARGRRQQIPGGRRPRSSRTGIIA